MQSGMEVADVFRNGADRFLSRYGHCHSREQHKVIRAITRCRTAELGGQTQFCHDCGHQRIQYHSCRNRQCPKCQAMARYLARYTHRVAISDRRILELRDGRVRFQYRDYADGQKSKSMMISTCEFIRRFLMHTLPSRFVRIRYSGFLANRFRKQRLDECRSLLGVLPAVPASVDDPQTSIADDDQLEAASKCPKCGSRHILTTELPSPHVLRPPHFLAARRKIPTSGRSPPS